MTILVPREYIGAKWAGFWARTYNQYLIARNMRLEYTGKIKVPIK
jgi:hypothetical protein